MKLKKYYFKDTLSNDFYFVEAKTIRGALTLIKKKKLVYAKTFSKTVYWTIFESQVLASNVRCMLVTYVLSSGDIKQDIL